MKSLRNTVSALSVLLMLALLAPAGASAATAIADCGGCHDYPPSDDASRNGSTGAFVGDHQKHSAYVCVTCHNAPAGETVAYFKHRDGNIEINPAGSVGVSDNGTYNGGTIIAQTNSPVTASDTCDNVNCHNNATSPVWGVGTTGCGDCHSLPPSTGGHDAHYAAKGWAADETNCTACHPNNTGAHSDVTDATPEVIGGVGYGGGSCSSAGGLGCHNDYATPDWSSGNAACADCHTAGGGNGADPNSGLHAVSNITVHDDTLSAGNCVNCHDGTSPSDNHWDGTLQASTSATYTFNANVVSYTSANGCQASCHSDSAFGAANTWSRKWNGVTDLAPLVSHSPGDAVCDNCHGDFSGWRWNEGAAQIADHSNPDPDNAGDYMGTGSHSDCKQCHGWGDGAYTAGSHQNGNITMNGDTSDSSGSEYDRTTGGCASNCHGAMDLTMTFNTGWTNDWIDGPAGGCGGCHDTGSGGAPVVSASSTHVDADGGSGSYSAGTCTDCHSGHADNSVGVNDVEIPTTGSIFTAGTYSAHASGKIQLGGAATSSYSVSTEAEMCWSCHDDNSISEWSKTWGSYQTGSMTNSNWVTGKWASDNFAYKTDGTQGKDGTIESTHGVNGGAQGVDAVSKISCTFCHDVHKVGKTAGGYTPAAAPYLRGTWISNPFPEDGAPQTTAHATVWGGVPRAGLGSAELGDSPNAIGGWQIEQNNPGAYSPSGTYTTFAGLCSSCHTQPNLESAWSGHASAVDGFSNAGASNIFTMSQRGGTTSYFRANMQHQGVITMRNAGSDYVYGLRESRDGDGILPQIPIDPKSANMQAGGVWAAMSFDDNGTPDPDFHNFPCSKCHNPHASRLPRLMITNCLDVRHNEWDDGQGDPSTWIDPGSTYTAKQLAYSPTAVNCHRKVDSGDTNRETNGSGEDGWNTVTPW